MTSSVIDSILRTSLVLSASLVGPLVGGASTDDVVQPLSGGEVAEAAFDQRQPIVIESVDQAAEVVENWDAIGGDVDFDSHRVLVFAWQGSGGDELRYAIQESFPETIVFRRTLGLTKDLRRHVRVFVVHRRARWQATGFDAPGDDDDPGNDDEPAAFVRVTMQGTLRTGIAAIGGETTGVTLTAGDITFELDLGQDPRRVAQAERLEGRLARAEGRLVRVVGVEVRERWIVQVDSLEPAGPSR